MTYDIVTLTEAINMIDALLNTTELNMDDMEPETVETINSAEALLVAANRQGDSRLE